MLWVKGVVLMVFFFVINILLLGMFDCVIVWWFVSGVVEESWIFIFLSWEKKCWGEFILVIVLYGIFCIFLRGLVFILFEIEVKFFGIKVIKYWGVIVWLNVGIEWLLCISVLMVLRCYCFLWRGFIGSK